MTTLDPVVNFGKIQASTGYDQSAVSITLLSGQGSKLPNPAVSGAYNLTWWNVTDYGDPSDDPNREIVRVTAVSSDTLTIQRAQEGTTATVKNLGDKTYYLVLSPTAKTISDILAAINARAIAGNNVSIFINDAGYITSGQAPVQSVNGQTGAVVLTTSNISEGSNPYFTNARAVTALNGQNVSIFNNNAGYITNSNGQFVNNATDSTLTKTGSGPYTLGINLGNANTWSGLQTFGNHISFGGATLNISELSSGQVLEYNGTNWVNTTISVSSPVGGADAIQFVDPVTGGFDGTQNFTFQNNALNINNIGSTATTEDSIVIGNDTGSTEIQYINDPTYGAGVSFNQIIETSLYNIGTIDFYGGISISGLNITGAPNIDYIYTQYILVGNGYSPHSQLNGDGSASFADNGVLISNGGDVSAESFTLTGPNTPLVDTNSTLYYPGTTNPLSLYGNELDFPGPGTHEHIDSSGYIYAYNGTQFLDPYNNATFSTANIGNLNFSGASITGGPYIDYIYTQYILVGNGYSPHSQLNGDGSASFADNGVLISNGGDVSAESFTLTGPNTPLVDTNSTLYYPGTTNPLSLYGNELDFPGSGTHEHLDSSGYIYAYNGNVSIDPSNNATFNTLFVNGPVTFGSGSAALGYGNTASSYNSSAIGYFNTASTYNGSGAFGSFNTASGTYSSAFGVINSASGNRSSSLGYQNSATACYSSAIGFQNTASGYLSSAFGSNLTNSTACSAMVGFDASNILINGSQSCSSVPLNTVSYTVATLPTGVLGMRTFVTDALTPAALAIVVGGGTSKVPVFFNGTNWIVN